MDSLLFICHYFNFFPLIFSSFSGLCPNWCFQICVHAFYNIFTFGAFLMFSDDFFSDHPVTGCVWYSSCTSECDQFLFELSSLPVLDAHVSLELWWSLAICSYLSQSCGWWLCTQCRLLLVAQNSPGFLPGLSLEKNMWDENEQTEKILVRVRWTESLCQATHLDSARGKLFTRAD